MLRQIVAVTGKPGLFKIITSNARTLVVEDLTTKKRFPLSARDKIVSLGDIAMYTDAADRPLGEILDLLYANQEGKQLDVKQLQKDGKLREVFAEVLPDFDRERVYDNDIKKLFTWYNILVESGMDKFAAKEEEAEAAEDTKE